MLSITKSICLQGLEGIIIDVEVDISKGMPCFQIVGLPDTNIKESKERVKTAIKNCGIEMESKKYIINLSPANVRKDGAVLDLAIAVGILSSLKAIKSFNVNEFVFIGELSLDGKLNKVNGILPICIEAIKNKIKKIVLPKDNVKEALILPGIEIIGVENLFEVINYLNGNLKISPEKTEINFNKKTNYLIDYHDVKGQRLIVRALEIAAAGNHNSLMIGPPGSGKTMMAKRITTIMPDLSFDEALEITKIYSISGKLKEGKIVDERPFRNPHYNITEKSLIGGGINPKPGEISLAHLGVLFLDELLEYKKNTLEMLRIPMEDKEINISRVGINVKYPCNFMLIASMNPCPCGYYRSRVKKCSCTDKQRNSYISKLSGPLLDRFDIQLSVSEVDLSKIHSDSCELSINIKKRVNLARNIQKERYKSLKIYSNSELTPKLIEKYCNINNSCKKILDSSFKKLNLSMRGYTKILKVARTIADIEQKENIEENHVLEAIQYRSFIK